MITNDVVMVNMKATRAWRMMAHKQAKERGMTFTEYVKCLVATDAEDTNWAQIADDLYEALTALDHPIPQQAVNSMAQYDRFKQGRF